MDACKVCHGAGCAGCQFKPIRESLAEGSKVVITESGEIVLKDLPGFVFKIPGRWF